MFGIEISYDWSWIYTLGTQPFYVIAWQFFISGGWVLFLVAFLYGAWINYVFLMQKKFGSKQVFVFLAVDIPRNNIQTPRAVENIFAALAGAHSPMEFWEKKIKGEYQLSFSFEIVSIDGYVQFIVRTPIQSRSLVEASIYSQYPDAEITEVNDYTADINVHFPSDEYNLWGADLVPVRPDYYPIRTYIQFQEELDKEFKDPMAALLEIMNKIGLGEQIWFQIIIIPADNDWHKKGLKAIDKITGVPEKVTRNLLDKITDVPLNFISAVGDHLMGTEAELKDKKEDKFDINRLTPMQKMEVEAIARKIDKINFNCKLRYVYFGKREVFKKGLGVSGIMGAVKQFNSTGSNGLKPDKNKTQARIMFTGPRLAFRQNKMLHDYKRRNPDTCKGTYILSVEELATIWHFPYIEVKAPLVKRIESKRSSAPIGLPLEGKARIAEEELGASMETRPAPAVDYDSDYFEKRFAKDKTGETDRVRKEQILETIKTKKATKEGETSQAEIKSEHPISVKPLEEKFREKKDNIPGNLPFS